MIERKNVMNLIEEKKTKKKNKILLPSGLESQPMGIIKKKIKKVKITNFSERFFQKYVKKEKNASKIVPIFIL